MREQVTGYTITGNRGRITGNRYRAAGEDHMGGGRLVKLFFMGIDLIRLHERSAHTLFTLRQ